MPRRRPNVRAAELVELAATQAGAITRRQALGYGMSPGTVEGRLRSGAWRSSGLPGVYLTFSGPAGHLTWCWAALLYAGAGATLCLETAAWVWGLLDAPASTVHVMVPVHRRVTPQRGLSVHIRTHLPSRRHPAKVPPVVRLEDTVLDLVERAESADRVVDLVLKACQRRLTTAGHLTAAAAARKKLRWRSLLVDVLTEVRDGVQSPLERLYLHDVERAHGLPRGTRNEAEGRVGRRRYRDIRYRRYRTVVELDGQAAHPGETRSFDNLRDNELVEEEGTRTLRYGWRPVAGRPCDTAVQVIRVLRIGGWTGRGRPCGPGCPVGVQARRAS